jgi:hypothetical protein
VALYPVAALLAHNVSQVQPSAALRPTVLSLGLATLLFMYNYHVQTELYILDTLPRLVQMPGGNTQDLYPRISRVNSFRVIFNDYFGAGYDLLPGESYTGFGLEGGDGRLVPETAPECLP